MRSIILKTLAVITYILMVVINILANALPINNRSTGQISDSYPNLFAPAGLTFSIWGLIYLLLAVYSIYQFGIKNREIQKLLQEINPIFILTSIINIFWIFSWHYDYIGLSVILMIILLILLVMITRKIADRKLTQLNKLIISTPFSVYFGWITVATIANISVFLVSINWNRFGIADFIWTSVILLVGAFIGLLRMHKYKDIAYGLVFIWAYLGILLKHSSASGFYGQYPYVLATIIFCLILFMYCVGKILYRK